MPYSFVAAAMASARTMTIWHFVNSFCLAYGGPLLGLFIIYKRYFLEKVVHYWAAIVVLAFLGGVNTIRFFSWASPVILILVAHLAQKFWNEPDTKNARPFGRILLIISGCYYIFMIHPFDGYYDNYGAWVDWGGLQFSSFRSIRFLVPYLILLFGFVVLGRKLVPDAMGRSREGNPPYPEAVPRL